MNNLNLDQNLHDVLSKTFGMYITAHVFHWNVRGFNFTQYHEYFKMLYDELHNSVDDIGEVIRSTGAMVKPMSLIQARFNVVGDISPEQMFQELVKHNDNIIETLNHTYEQAEFLKDYAVSNFLQDRIQTHRKHGWTLISFLEGFNFSLNR